MGYLTQDSLALKLGKTQSTIANKLRLLNLDDDVQEALLNEKISERHARSLLKLTSHEKQRTMLNRIVTERLTVRKTDEEIDKMMNNNGNNEFLNFGNPMETVPSNNDTIDFNNMSNSINNGLNSPANNEPVEFLDIFGNSNNQMNIPTEPITGDSIPEVLPTQEPVKPFVPEPVVFEPIFKEESKVQEQPINIPFGINDGPSVESSPINNDVNFFNNSGVNEIYKEQPLAPMDNLLQSSNDFMPKVDIPVTPSTDNDDEGDENLLVPGKFFNLMPEEDETPAVEEKRPITSDFNFDFDINSLNNIESTSNLEQSKVDNVLENNNNSFPSFDSFFNFNNFEPVTSATDKVETPAVENVNTEENLIPEAYVEMPTLPEFKFDTPTIEPVQNVNNDFGINPFELGNNNQPSSTDVQTAIKMIKDLNEQLSKMGYNVSIDEFDFENMYQVIFKINK